MKCIRPFALVIILSGLAVTPARAEFYRDFAHALGLFDYRFSGEQNLLGDGFTINANALYNNRRFNFGVADLTLNGAVNMSLDVTKRGLPAVEFGMNTAGSPGGALGYTFNINNGIQDLTATGSVLIDTNTRINTLGFYDQTLQISNRGQFATDGFGVVDSGTLDYDVGPIDIHGNIFGDVLAAVTEPIFAASGEQNPFAKFSAKATKAIEAEKKADELKARIDAGEVLSDDEIASLVNNTIISAMLGGQPDTNALSGLLIPKGMLSDEGLSLEALSITQTPEPASLTLLALALPLLRRPRRRAIAA